MKTTLATLTAAIALLSAGAANAADMYAGNGGGYKDGPVVAGIPISGFYGEFLGGGGFSQSELASVVNLSSTGGVFIARVGYDRAFAGKFGLGVWAEGSNSSDVNSSIASFVKIGENWGWGAGGKVFYDHGGGQVYALLGYEGVDETVASVTKQLDGFVWGGGISLKLVGNFYGKLEFNQVRYTDLSQYSSTLPVKWAQTDDRILLGVGYSLGQ